MVVAAIYLLVTSVSGRLLVAGGVPSVPLLRLLVVMEVRTRRSEQRRDASARRAQLNGPTPRYRATYETHHTWIGVSSNAGSPGHGAAACQRQWRYRRGPGLPPVNG